MKSAHRTTNQIKSLTLLLSLAEGADIADLQGKRVRLTVPLNNLEYDGEPGRDAYFYALVDYQLGSASTPAPAGLRLVHRGGHVWSGSDATSPRKAVISRLVFDLDIAADAVAFADIPLVVKGFHAASDAPADFTFPAFSSTADPVLAVTDKDGGAVGLSYEIIPCACSPLLTAISGQETITDLAVGTATEITVDHSAEALFSTCEYPRVVAPYGVRVTVLASGIGADSTSEGQFVLLVENVSYVTDGGYGTSTPDVTLDWTRTGVVA